jgi:hypothetical protein
MSVKTPSKREAFVAEQGIRGYSLLQLHPDRRDTGPRHHGSRFIAIGVRERRSLRTRTIIKLYLKGSNKPLVIPGNTKSPGMDVDLLTWLLGKVAR